MDVPGAQPVVVPPVLYLPIRSINDGVPFAEVRLQADGSLALLAFTALDRLLDACGAEQPWIYVLTEALGEFRARQGFDKISFDPVISEHLRSGERLL
jgi:hypothetical protein